MKKLLAIVGICWGVHGEAQQSFPYPNPYFKDSVNSFTTAQQRQAHRQYLIDSVIRQGLRQPLDIHGIRSWHGAFWAMETLLYKDAFTEQRLKHAWQQPASYPEAFQKALLEATYTLYPTTFQQQVKTLLQNTRSVPVFVRCAEYLLRAQPSAAQRQMIRSLLLQKFSSSKHPGVEVLQQKLTAPPVPKPSIATLFHSSFLPGQTVIYSLQRSSREYAGLVLIRKSDGSFVRDSKGRLFQAAQLARAITNYPYYITNGNTPQGILRWTGFGQSENSYIGPTTNLQLVLPVEAPVHTYFNDSIRKNEPWSQQAYASLLPAAWLQHPALWEAYQAGQMGRSEIIMHGTTIDPAYYKGRAYFPQTPSLGCLCSYEEWDAQGRLKHSEQQKIVDALSSIGASNGFVVVIDLDNQPKPVTIGEVELLLRKR